MQFSWLIWRRSHLMHALYVFNHVHVSHLAWAPPGSVPGPAACLLAPRNHAHQAHCHARSPEPSLSKSKHRHHSMHSTDRDAEPHWIPPPQHPASIDCPFFCCMELIVSTLPLNWGCCRTGNYCSLGWAICCLLQQALLCESADERVACKLQLCVCVYMYCLHMFASLCVVWGWWAGNTWPFPGKQRLLIVFSNGST